MELMTPFRLGRHLRAHAFCISLIVVTFYFSIVIIAIAIYKIRVSCLQPKMRFVVM